MAGVAAAVMVIPAVDGHAGTGIRARAVGRTPQAQTRPNVVFILIDDVGYGDPSITGDRKVATPNFDRLAHEGLLMTQFYDAAPICSASRAGFFTGQYPARNRFVTFINWRRNNAEAGQADWLDLKLSTLARAMHDSGYATGHFGKWHMGGGRDVGDARCRRNGFDESYTQFEGLGPRVVPTDSDNSLGEASVKLGRRPVGMALKSEMTPRVARAA